MAAATRFCSIVQLQDHTSTTLFCIIANVGPEISAAQELRDLFGDERLAFSLNVPKTMQKRFLAGGVRVRKPVVDKLFSEGEKLWPSTESQVLQSAIHVPEHIARCGKTVWIAIRMSSTIFAVGCKSIVIEIADRIIEFRQSTISRWIEGVVSRIGYATVEVPNRLARCINAMLGNDVYNSQVKLSEKCSRLARR